MNATELDIG